MKIKYSWMWFFSSILAPIIIFVFLIDKMITNQGYHFEINILIIYGILLLFTLINCYKFFFTYYIVIDKDIISIDKNFYKKKLKVNEIKWISSQKRWIILADNNLKETKIAIQYIRTSSLTPFLNELSSRTKLEIKAY